MNISIWVLLFMLTGCLSPSLERRDLSGEDSGTTTVDPNDLVVLPNTGNFLQVGSIQYAQTMNLDSAFNDNFLLRGNEVINFISQITMGQDTFCLAVPFMAGDKKIMLMNLKTQSYLNYITGKKEYYFQVFPGNKTENQSNCQNANLINSVNAELGSSYVLADAAFKLSDICPSCTNSILSQNFTIYKNNTVKVNLTLSALKFRLMPATISGGGTGPSCLINETCVNAGYGCCLNNQCVNDAAVKANVDLTNPDFLQAQQDVLMTPSNYKKYPEYYYICPIGGGGNNDPPETNPNAEAIETVKTMQDLYNCLNPLEDDDIGICTKKILNASSLIGTSGTVVSVSQDDLNMNSLNPLIANQNITEIDYSGTILYKQNEVSLAAANGSFLIGTENDDLTLSQDVFISAPLPVSAPIDILRVRYSVLGTCEKISSGIAKCTKIYKQGQVSTPAKSTDHATSQTFALPAFADMTYNLIVKVGDIIKSEGPTTWSKSGQNIVFTETVSDNKKVEITFFVTTSVTELTESIVSAQTALDALCGFEEANLEPILNPETGNIENFKCISETDGSADPPFQGTVYLDTKTVPHKYYDTNGAYWTPDKIDQAPAQEGTPFEYVSSNTLRPNNVVSPVGFNEIYGSFKTGSTPPIPTQVITVVKNQIYDIYTDTGSFSTCVNCGTDYFSNIQKAFADVFNTLGGGYTPEPVQTSRITNFGKYRSDDLLFGRACFVPATMIPWTHASNTNITQQRQNRQKAQHFLFANGYNRDWYGFDYGSVIGSFDGVTWFSIGSERRITAKSNKLYLAINAYFGDQTITNTYKVQVQASNGIPGVGPDADHDSETDGAQCQQNHFCSTDQDCIGNLGYDYVCESVSGIKTPWPVIDQQGNEETGSLIKSIASLVGGTNGQNKRCVYRGRGAPCERGDIYNLSSSFNESSKPMLASCAPNHHCAQVTDNKYNLKITRYAASPQNQNASSYVTTDSDLFGLNARIMGRPFELIGTDSMPADVMSQFNQTKVKNICVPSRTPIYATANLLNLQQSSPPIRRDATDEVSNIGSTMPHSVVTQNQSYYLACPATDENGQYVNRVNEVSTLNTLRDTATAQNISSNLLDHSDFDGTDLFSDTQSPRKDIGIDKNVCLRAPGATCFTDFDCAGNTWMNTKIRNLANFLNLNIAEQEFWETEFICGNPEAKFSDLSNTINPDFDLSENRCCRDRSKDFTNYSQPHEGSTFTSSYALNSPATPGVTLDYRSNARYTAHQIVHDKVKNDANYSALRVPAANPGTPFTLNDILKQYNTLHEINSKMCCTGNWIRKFSDSNSGGHTWNFNRAQNIPRSIFRHANWVNNISGDPFKCTILDYATSDCEIRYIAEGSTYEQTTLNWLGRLELAGIPQITIDPNESLVLVDENQVTLAGRPLGYTDSGEVLIKDFASGTVDATKDAVFANDGVDDHFSLNDETDFGSGLKKVFSDKDFACCEAAGKVVSENTTNSMCCTGQVATSEDDGKKRCCLPDFTDITVYLNRYVSSEGAGLSESSYDPETGYIKNPELVKQIALDRGLCCSGRVAMGVALFNLQIPIFDTAGNPVTNGLGQNSYSRRFVSGAANDTNEAFNNNPQTGNIGNIYDYGVRWNNHVYCVEKGYQDPYP